MAGLRFDFEDLINGLTDLETKSDIAVGMLCETAAKNLETDAKAQAPWTDRTGAARQRLQGYTYRKTNGWRIVLSHGVDYGIWLELAHEKRFAIVGPLINLSGPYILKDFENLFKKIHVSGAGSIHTSFGEE